MMSDALLASKLMNQMANGMLQNANTRKELNDTLKRLNDGSKTINDLVNKEGYDAASATKEYNSYLSNFKNPDLMELENMKDPGDFERGFAAGARSNDLAAPSGESSASGGLTDAQLMQLLKESGFEATSGNLAMLREASQEGKTTESGKSAASIPSAPSDRPEILLTNGTDSRVDALDHLGIPQGAEKAGREIASEAALAGFNVKFDGGAAPSNASREEAEGLITPEQAELILSKQMSKEEAKAIIAKLKAQAGNSPKRFSQLFKQYQNEHLANHLMEKTFVGFLKQGITKTTGITFQDDSEEVPMAAWLALALAFATISYYGYRAYRTSQKSKPRIAVVPKGEPRWARMLRAAALPHAPKSSRFRKNKLPKAS